MIIDQNLLHNLIQSLLKQVQCIFTSGSGTSDAKHNGIDVETYDDRDDQACRCKWLQDPGEIDPYDAREADIDHAEDVAGHHGADTE